MRRVQFRSCGIRGIDPPFQGPAGLFVFDFLFLAPVFLLLPESGLILLRSARDSVN